MNKNDVEQVARAAALVASAAIRAAKGDPYIAHRILRVAASAVCEMSGGTEVHPGALEVWTRKAVAILRKHFVAERWQTVPGDLHAIDVNAEVDEPPRRLFGRRK